MVASVLLGIHDRPHCCADRLRSRVVTATSMSRSASCVFDGGAKPSIISMGSLFVALTPAQNQARKPSDLQTSQ